MKKQPVRSRLIETASKLFYERGYNRTGINEILKESGVAKASMYQHFRSKEEIGVQYLKLMDKGLYEGLEKLIAAKSEGKDKVLALFEFMLEFFHSGNFRGCWCQNTISEISMDDSLMMEEIRNEKEAFRRFVRNLVAENLSNTADSELSDKIYLLYEVGIMESQLFMKDWPIHQARKMAEIIIQ